MNILDEKLGKEGNLELEFVDGELRLSASLDTKGADVGIYVTLDSDYFLDKLAAAIPGKIDDIIIETLKASFKE